MLVLACGLDIFEREHQKKGALKQKIEASLYTFYWGLKKIPFTIYTYVLAEALQSGGKFIQMLTRGFKNHTSNSNTPDKHWKFQKVEI